MPASRFICPDNETISIQGCLQEGGCRMPSRCASVPYLRLIGYDREWKGVSPSSAGNGPRLIYLKQISDYAINPDDRAFAALGTAVHGKLSLQAYTYNVLSEEKLSSEQMDGIPDLLEQDEQEPGYYILTDYKTWGSFKVAKGIGIYQKDVPVLAEDGSPVLLKSGPNKGQPKITQETTIDPSMADLRVEELQLNRYRIFFESLGFPISKMQIQAITRDGNTFIAKNRGIDRNLYIIPINWLPDMEVETYYNNLRQEVAEAFNTGEVRKCNLWETWDGRRCENYCEVFKQCNDMGE